MVSSYAYLKSDLHGKMIARCAGAAHGCTHNWATPCWKTCIFKHAVGCTKLDKIDAILRDKVQTAVAGVSLGDCVANNPLLVESEDGQPTAKHIKMPTQSPKSVESVDTLMASKSAHPMKQTSIFPA